MLFGVFGCINYPPYNIQWRTHDPDTMFYPVEIDLTPGVVLKIPVIEGTHFEPCHPNPAHLYSARIERPILPRDVFEARSAQARSPHFTGFVFDENNRVIGRNVRLESNL